MTISVSNFLWVELQGLGLEAVLIRRAKFPSIHNSCRSQLSLCLEKGSLATL